MNSNVTTALAKFGGGRGFQEVRSRDCTGAIEIEIKFRQALLGPLVTYQLNINEQDGRPVVEREVLRYRRGSRGNPWHFLNFSNGQGQAVVNELDEVEDERHLQREEQTLKSADLLAIKGLAQFKKFPAAVDLGNLIERWHISDFHINSARPEREAGYAEHLSREGENLSLVTQYLYNNHRKKFSDIIAKLGNRVPGHFQR